MCPQRRPNFKNKILYKHILYYEMIKELGGIKFKARTKYWNHLYDICSEPYTEEDVQWMRDECEPMSLIERYEFLNNQCFASLLPFQSQILSNNPLVSIDKSLKARGMTKDDHTIVLRDVDVDTLVHEMTHSFLLYFRVEDGEFDKYIGDIKVNDEMIEEFRIDYDGPVQNGYCIKNYMVSYAGHNRLFGYCLFNIFRIEEEYVKIKF